MGYILITGASGFIGKATLDGLVAQDHQVYALYRNPPEKQGNVITIKGDVLQENLGIDAINASSLPKFERVYHIAGIVNLGPDRDGVIYKTNATGTRNVVDFCTAHGIPHILYCSTAYTGFRNPYEKSKAVAELAVRQSSIPVKTIFKPSIVLGTPAHPYLGHFSQYVSMIVRVHRRAEKLRRAVEGGLRLPQLRPVFRAHGNPDAYLNLVSVDKVIDKIVNVTDPGTFWLTNPHPPTLRLISEWISRTILVDFKFELDFKATPVEYQLSRLVSAFTPYLNGDDFPSNIESDELTYEFINWTINNQLERG